MSYHSHMLELKGGGKWAVSAIPRTVRADSDSPATAEEQASAPKPAALPDEAEPPATAVVDTLPPPPATTVAEEQEAVARKKAAAAAAAAVAVAQTAAGLSRETVARPRGKWAVLALLAHQLGSSHKSK